MAIDDVLETIAKRKKVCKLFPPSRLPEIGPGESLPEDVIEFYQRCGGAQLFTNSNFPFTIPPAEQFCRANPVIIKEPAEYDISFHWYICAYEGTSRHVTIDLSPPRLGRCYDSYWDRHGIVGSCSVIALSFTEFLTRYLASKGQDLYWARGKPKYGDAYDGLT